MLGTATLSAREAASAVHDGLFFGNPRLLGSQVVAVTMTWLHAAVSTLVLLGLQDQVMGMRLEADGGDDGLDVNHQGESAYGA